MIEIASGYQQQRWVGEPWCHPVGATHRADKQQFAIAVCANEVCSVSSRMPAVLSTLTRRTSSSGLDSDRTATGRRAEIRRAVWAATAGGAAALRRDGVGRIRPGARADLAQLTPPSCVHLAYRPGGAVDRKGVEGPGSGLTVFDFTVANELIAGW